jgi:hypothetical protein
MKQLMHDENHIGNLSSQDITHHIYNASSLHKIKGQPQWAAPTKHILSRLVPPPLGEGT